MEIKEKINKTKLLPAITAIVFITALAIMLWLTIHAVDVYGGTFP